MIGNSKHVPVLDSLRAFAALSVCLFHFTCTVTGFIDSPLVLQIFSVGHYGVQVFFVISGFIIPWSMYHNGYLIKHYFVFALKRFIRLEPPYIVSLMVAIAHTYVRVLSPHYNGMDITPDLKQVMLHFGYLIPFVEGEKWIRPVYWTLAVEFQYYLSLGLLFPLLASQKLFFRIPAYLLILSGPLLFSDFLPFHLPVFLLGIALFLYRIKFIGKLEHFALVSAAAAEILIFHTTGTLLFSAIAYFAILFYSDFKNRILSFLGDISYSLYLFHSLTGLVIINYFSHTVTSPILKFLLILFAISVTIVVSYLVYRFVELPSKKLSSRIKYQKKK